MMKWLKRLLFVVIVAIVATLALSAAGYYKYRSAPQWYSTAPVTLEPGEPDPADVLIDRVTRLQNHIADPAQRGKVTSLVVTDRQLQATLDRWRTQFDSVEMDGLMVRLSESGMLLAANSQAANAVLSLSGRPMLNEEGKLVVHDITMHAGTLWIPHAATAIARKRGAAQLRAEAANIPQNGKPENGRVNANVASVAMLELMASVLSDEPAEPVVYVPVDGNSYWYVPLRIDRIQFETGQLELHLVPLDP